MCILDNALKRGIATTMFSGAATIGAITGAILMGGTAATVALIVASVALAVFTLISLLGTTVGAFEDVAANHSNPNNPKAMISRKSANQTHSSNMLSVLMFFPCFHCKAVEKKYLMGL